jgi:hypothetical protein
MSIKQLLDRCRTLVSFQEKDKVNATSRRDLLRVGGTLLGSSALLATIPMATNTATALAAPKPKTLVVDLVVDGNTFVNNQGDTTATITNAKRGQSYVIQGKLYPGNTIDASTQPGAAGFVGTWNCWGVLNVVGTDVFKQGEMSPLLSTQYLQFDNGDEIISIGAQNFLPDFPRAITGGVGDLTGAAGVVDVAVLGINSSQWPNIRFTIKYTVPKIK